MELQTINEGTEMRPLPQRYGIPTAGQSDFERNGAKQDILLEGFVEVREQVANRLAEHDLRTERQFERWRRAVPLDFADSASGHVEKLAELALRKATAQALGFEIARKTGAGHVSAPAAYAGALIRIPRATTSA